MMWPTFRTSTANWTVERQLRSVWTTTLATLRWTNISPGRRPTIWLAGTRLSEQPIQRYCGACWPERRRKNSGSCRVISAAHERLLAKRWLRTRISVPTLSETALQFRPPPCHSSHRQEDGKMPRGKGGEKDAEVITVSTSTV